MPIFKISDYHSEKLSLQLRCADDSRAETAGNLTVSCS